MQDVGSAHVILEALVCGETGWCALEGFLGGRHSPSDSAAGTAVARENHDEPNPVGGRG